MVRENLVCGKLFIVDLYTSLVGTILYISNETFDEALRMAL